MKKSMYSFFSSPMLFGHRGCSIMAPENTMPAFDLCVEHNIPAVELDVQLCKSGELVITHDFNMYRVSGYDGVVSETPYEEIRELDAGKAFNEGKSTEEKFPRVTIPLLRDLFEKHGKKLKYDIELKHESTRDTRLALEVLTLIQEFGMEDYCMISSFNPYQLRAFRKACANTIPTAIIYSDTPDIPVLLRHGAGKYIAQCTALKPHHPLISEKNLKVHQKRKGYRIIAWTVDIPSEAKKLVDAGVDGIISNQPEKIAHLFGI